MSQVVNTASDFIIIGENIHTTRSVRLGGSLHTTLEGDVDAIRFRDVDNNRRLMKVPEHFKKTQPYQQGQLKHYMIAVWKGMNEEGDDAAEGVSYIEREIARQVKAGAKYLDLNVDEFSYRVPEQQAAMTWLVGTDRWARPLAWARAGGF